jgi:hypothetical protein
MISTLSPVITAIRRAAGRRRLVKAIYEYRAAQRDHDLAALHTDWAAERVQITESLMCSARIHVK